jgi:hypothetical protein
MQIELMPDFEEKLSMKVKIVLLMTILLLIPAVMSQAYPLVPIDSIQAVACGHDSSLMAGDTVITGGMIVGGTGLYYAGSGVTFYMENPAGGPFSGIMAYNTQAEGFPVLIPGDSILCTAKISEYWDDYSNSGISMTELLIVPGSFQYRMYGLPEPDPVLVGAVEIDSTAGADSCAEQYEGVFVRVPALTVDSVVNYTTTSTWICHDSTGAHCFIRIAVPDTIIPFSFRPAPGTYFDFIQGVCYHRFGAMHVQPRYFRDLRLGAGAPIVAASNSPKYPLLNETVKITANVVDDDPIPADSVRLYYRINRDVNWVNVPMAYQSNNNFTYQLPSPVDGWIVDYYVRAVDDSNNVTRDPYEAPFSFHEYVVQQPNAMTIAQARIDANYDFVPDLLDSAVIVTGIVVSTNYSTALTDFFMEQEHAGIEVYFDSTQILINPGDSVTANGVIGQFNGKTQLRVYKSSRITNWGQGHLPDTLVITCHDLLANGEAYEGTLVKVSNSKILPDPNAWPALGFSATMSITTSNADTATLFISSATDIDGQVQADSFATIVGVVSQYDLSTPYDSYYELVPRYYTDFTWGFTGPRCHYTVGDVNNNSTFNGIDVTYGVSYFKGGPPPPFSCECTSGNTWFVAGDVNASCNFNGIDITYMVSYFKGGALCRPCPDCAPAGFIAPPAPNAEPIPAVVPAITPTLKVKASIGSAE